MSKSQESSELKLKEKLQKLLDKAQSGKSSPNDLQEAMELNDLLGGGFSSAVSLIAQAIEQQQQASSKDTSIKDPILQAEKLIAEDEKYFESAEVKKSEETAIALAEGKDVSSQALSQRIKNITSKKDRAYREDKIKKYTEVMDNIFERAFEEARELTSKESKLYNKINQKRTKHIERYHHNKAATKIIGEHENEKAKEVAIKKHENQLKKVSKELSNTGLAELAKITSASVEDSMAILKANREASPEQRAAARPGIIQGRKQMHEGLLNVDLTPSLTQNSRSQTIQNLKNFKHTTPIERVDPSTPKTPDATPSLKGRTQARGV